MLAALDTKGSLTTFVRWGNRNGVQTIAELTNPIANEARVEARTSLFVMAALYTDSGSSPVKVRDLSSAGALLEGGSIALPGTMVRLCRGSLSVAGEVIWRRGERAGVRFHSSVSVGDWLPGRGAIAPQQLVDEMVQQIKGSGTVTGGPPSNSTTSSAEVSASELIRVRLAIESLAEDLSADPDIVKRHMAKLQSLDLAAQLLKKLARNVQN